MEKHEYDVVVVGKGNAALCAALAAKDQGAPRLGDAVRPSAGAALGTRVRNRFNWRTNISAGIR